MARPDNPAGLHQFHDPLADVVGEKMGVVHIMANGRVQLLEPTVARDAYQGNIRRHRDAF
jgi:hypothetical protein